MKEFKMKKFSQLSLLTLLLTACQVIHINNGKESVVTYPQDEWHQIGIFQVAEFSDPVDLSQRCDGKDWVSAQTRMSPGQVLLGLVPYLGYAWSPLEVAYACK
jgi:hypothetical protein